VIIYTQRNEVRGCELKWARSYKSRNCLGHFHVSQQPMDGTSSRSSCPSGDMAPLQYNVTTS